MNEPRKIAELGSDTVRLITATQIATSVSDIVKELVENSLDAGSTIIRVKLENCGLDKIEVSDNGSGISKEDLQVCALPHYTSKISQHEDLESLTTYGFRGEALAAVCSVAKVKVTTKTSSDLVATSSTFDHQGRLVDTKPAASGQGTTIIACQLFHNVPVRKQFYAAPKRKKDELSKVEDLLLNFGLIHPQLHLSLHHNHTPVWQKNRAPDFRANILQVLGHSISSQMEFVQTDDEIQLFLMTPKLEAPVEVCFRSRPDRCFTFVNDRPIICKPIEKTMKELYEHVSSKSTLYPIYIVSLKFPGTELDVNLEPNKSQVLMKRQSEVLELIKSKVGQIVKREEVTPCKVLEQKVANEGKAPSSNMENLFEDDDDLFNGFCEPFSQPSVPEAATEAPAPAPVTQPRTLEDSTSSPSKIAEQNVYIPPVPAPVGTPSVAPSTCSTGTVAIGSDEWCKGIAKDSSGRIVHPVQLLRGGDHFAKRISEEQPNGGQSSKRARLIETEEAVKIVGSPPAQLETCNGRVRRLPSDPYEFYCKEMTQELLSQNPTTTFNELTQQLNQGWRNLGPGDRHKYEQKALFQKQRLSTTPKPQRSHVTGGSSLDRFLCPQTPVVRATSGRVFSTMRSTVVSVQFDLEVLRSRWMEPASKSRKRWSFVGYLERPRGFFCSYGHDLYAVNFLRLYEVILYWRMLEHHHLPSRKLSEPFLIHSRSFDPFLWDVLVGLSTEWDSPTSRLVDDSRMAANGVTIRIQDDGAGNVRSAQMIKTPAEIPSFGLEELRDILKQIAKPDSSVGSCRPVCVQKLLKYEAARVAAERVTEPEPSELCDLLEQWHWNDDNLCLHGESVVEKLKSTC